MMQQDLSAGYSKGWEDLRKQARRLENEIDSKLVSFSKLGTGHTGIKADSDTEPLLSTEHVFETMALDLTSVNDRLGEVSAPDGPGAPSNAALIHTLQRHKEILQDYKQEFLKTRANWQARREREDLLRSVRKDIDTYKSSSGLNRRMDLYLKENEHIRSSDRLVDEQINIAMDTRENLMSQRLNFKRIQTRMHDLSSRFPAVNSLLQRINLRKRRDSLIIGAIVGVCTFLMLLYAFN
ncbi:Golgi SNAP receptor complex member 1 [Frankliniella fusca]|uniref:Golgi SNAP receptor complex member 1 n=1 Tax=Frankliniella fusca TaxID=407009 RepID=A0AAE1HCR1_9NEOP|nr:Golgi SNAP receptor complex member 1 [Frankliniella fusca]